ncbi:MAG: ATP-binding protein [Sulfurimonas sp.]|nr:ATP-binding protein [Sulfurimonas sp.]
MKKNIFIAFVFVSTLCVIIFYILRNGEIVEHEKLYAELRNISYELEISIDKQHKNLELLKTQNNYDGVVKENLDLKKRFQYYELLIKKTKNVKLDNLFYDMKQKIFTLEHIYEDIKTDNAVMKNSQMWLSKTYINYVTHSQNTNLDKDVLLYIFNAISPYKSTQNNTFKKIESDFLDVDTFNAHLYIIYEKKKSLSFLEKSLDKNTLFDELDKVILYTLREVHSLQEETETIIKRLLFTSAFLLLFGLILYVREIVSANETKRLKNELQQFVDALNESAIVSKTDIKGVITYVNDKFCEVSGYKREELVGFGHNIIRHPDMDSKVFTQLWSTVQNKNVFKATLHNRAKNGDSYYVDTTIKAILDIHGEIIEYLAVRYDVTDLTLSRDRAVLAEKAKGEFLSNMSHELRTPLNSINGFSAILSRLIKDEKHLKYLKNIMDSSDNLIGLINDILDLSKLQSGKFSLDYHDFNLEEKLLVLLERFDALLLASDLRLVRYFDENIKVSLQGDWLRISQIITNIMSNAIKFSSAGKEIQLSISYEKEELKIQVRDFGIGLSQEAQTKIFNAFEQADNSTTRQYGGTGLGLSIVLNLIEQMKGTIDLQSTEGEGSCFSIMIPLKEAKVLQEQEESQEDEQRELLSAYVLIAEDNKTNQMLIGILMEEFGLDFKIANDGVEAVEMFGKEKFDLVLMDENMPNLNGCDAMKKIHSFHGNDVPIVALTANAMTGDKQRFLDSGMDDYVAKPIDDEELYKVIKRLLRKNK